MTTDAKETYRLDRVKARRVELLEIIGSNSVLLENVQGLVRDGDLRRENAVSQHVEEEDGVGELSVVEPTSMSSSPCICCIPAARSY